ncbi:MAG: hypothetical protein ACTSR8_00745 [Promethearchaeota archaeon]
MDSVNLEEIINLLKEIEKKKAKLSKKLVNLDPLSREKILKDIYENILTNSSLIKEFREGSEILFSETDSPKTKTSIERIIDEIQMNPTKKVFVLKEFLDNFPNISETDKNALLSSLENTEVKDLAGKMSSLLEIFKINDK